MNDFTKDELESIWNCVDLYTDHPHHPYQELLNKIQSMIDDYSECNHKEIITGAYPRSNSPKKCDACGELYR